MSPSDSEGLGRIPAASTKIDGRRLRSERTRQLIIEAYMMLVRETGQVPTAQQIAERAGYSVRSVFERFPDLEALRVAVTDYAIAEGRHDSSLRDVDADRATRIRSQVASRAAICEKWLPLWRVLNTQKGSSEELAKRVHLIRQLVRARLELMFQKELATLGEPQRRNMLIALESITDYECWGRMRELHGMPVERAEAVWIRAIDRLLPDTPKAS